MATELFARGWVGVRVEGTNYGPVLAQCQKHHFAPLWILDRGQEASVPGGIACEVGNECNAGCGPRWQKLSSADYTAWVLEAWPVLRAKGNVCYVGAANNTSPSGIQWTKEVLAKLPMHPDLRVSFHRYPDGDQNVTKPKKGYASLAAEDAAILDCVRGRRWAISEAGLVDCTTTSGFWFWKKTVMRTAVAGHRTQAARFRRLGADFYVYYQMQDEGGQTSGYGVRGNDGLWKATANLPTL